MPSREPELYKDKIEVSLDGRQIFYLFFGGAVLVGMVFVLGVMVGRRVESRSHVDQLSRHDSARTASDPLAALDGLESRKLSFQDALTKTSPGTAVDAKIEQLDAKPASKPELRPEPKAEPKPEPKPDKQAKPEKQDKPEKAEKQEKPKPAEKADKKADEPKPKKKAEKAEQARRDEPVNGDVVTAADAKPVVKPEAKPDKAADKAKFTLQLSSFQDKKEAEAFLSSVKAAGYQAYVTEADVSGKAFYRVRLGRYGSLDAANDAKAEIEKTIKKSASVMRL
jgi:DedD protein